MIGVYITINGKTIFARTAVNRLKEHGVYIGDDGTRIDHNPDDGAIVLAKKMLDTITDDVDKLSYCDNCNCMTKSVGRFDNYGICGKCKAVKV